MTRSQSGYVLGRCMTNGLFMALLGACGDSPPAPTLVDTGGSDTFADATADTTFEDPLTLLIDHALWQQLDESVDPFLEHRPEEFECGEAGLYKEDGYLEIDTGICNYVSITQPSLEALQPGETLEASLWYGPLLADGVFEAHAAIVLDGEVVWERSVPIPNPGGLAVALFEPQRTYPAGTPLIFHLHNHGLNTWNLVYIGKY
jgi:hypothetical protein